MKKRINHNASYEQSDAKENRYPCFHSYVMSGNVRLPPNEPSSGTAAEQDGEMKMPTKFINQSQLAGAAAVACDLLALQPRPAGAMTQETRRERFVDYQRFARLVSQEACQS